MRIPPTSWSPVLPVVVVMGHVDHGKTSPSRLCPSRQCRRRRGGRHHAAHRRVYCARSTASHITFLDTPGHAAFTAMRARGAMCTDIAILVVAADDGIMPQTVEAINHAKAAEIPIIVAVNKMDKHGANPDRILTQLTEHGLTPAEWGGETEVCKISAKTGMGIDDLLETVILTAEMRGTQGQPEPRAARACVIEARLDKARGPIATLLVQNGTLHQGDLIIAGTAVGRVRVMTNDKGAQVKDAGPSIPVEITGLAEVPDAGRRIQRRRRRAHGPPARRAAEAEDQGRRQQAQPEGHAREPVLQAAGGRDEGAEPHHQGRRAGQRRGAEGFAREDQQRRGPRHASSTPASARSTSPTSCWPRPRTPSSSASTSARTTSRRPRPSATTSICGCTASSTTPSTKFPTP